MKKLFGKHTGHCHCGFERSLEGLRRKTGKRLGALGATFMVLHLLFHVVECIVVPAILVGINQRVVAEDAAAVSEVEVNLSAEVLDRETDFSGRNSLTWNFVETSQNLTLDYRLQLF